MPKLAIYLFTIILCLTSICRADDQRGAESDDFFSIYHEYLLDTNSWTLVGSSHTTWGEQSTTTAYFSDGTSITKTGGYNALVISDPPNESWETGAPILGVLETPDGCYKHWSSVSGKLEWTVQEGWWWYSSGPRICVPFDGEKYGYDFGNYVPISADTFWIKIKLFIVDTVSEPSYIIPADKIPRSFERPLKVRASYLHDPADRVFEDAEHVFPNLFGDLGYFQLYWGKGTLSESSATHYFSETPGSAIAELTFSTDGYESMPIRIEIKPGQYTSIRVPMIRKGPPAAIGSPALTSLPHINYPTQIPDWGDDIACDCEGFGNFFEAENLTWWMMR